MERVEDPSEVSRERVHYLPHHGVVRKEKETTKSRVVYDGSAQAGSVSLNDCLFIDLKFIRKCLIYF